MALEKAAEAKAEAKEAAVEAAEDDSGKNRKTGEWNGPRGPEPTRFGDWEQGGRCSDF